MKKLLSIIFICLLWSNVSIADELSNDFINKNFSKNEIFKKYKERSDIMKNFFSGSVDIKAKGIEYKFYYAGREDTKSGQFYIFYIKNSQPIINYTMAVALVFQAQLQSSILAFATV